MRANPANSVAHIASVARANANLIKPTHNHTSTVQVTGIDDVVHDFPDDIFVGHLPDGIFIRNGCSKFFKTSDSLIRDVSDDSPTHFRNSDVLLIETPTF